MSLCNEWYHEDLGSGLPAKDPLREQGRVLDFILALSDSVSVPWDSIPLSLSCLSPWEYLKSFEVTVTYEMDTGNGRDLSQGLGSGYAVPWLVFLEADRAKTAVFCHLYTMAPGSLITFFPALPPARQNTVIVSISLFCREGN
jgi:hypothetical protein